MASSYSGLRAPSNADRRSSTQAQTLLQPSANGNSNYSSTMKSPSTQTGFGVNAADRKAGRRSPFKTSDQSQQRRKDPSRAYSHDGVTRSASTAKRGRHDGSRVPWSPQVTLMSISTAPLASRVSQPPLSSLAPKELQPPHLTTLNLQEQEQAILEDILFTFMGFEGQYIRFAESYNPFEEKERLNGPTFRTASGLDPSLRDLSTSMLKMASHYIALEAFVEVQSREEFGLVNHALCASIRTLLKDYLTLVSQLEHQFLTNPNFTLHMLSLHTRPTSHLMFHMYTIAHEILRKNALLEADLDESDDMDDVDNIIESLREGRDAGGLAVTKVCKGGNVLGLITKRLSAMSGDPAAKGLLTTLLRDASKPYMAMLNEWLHHGGIRDPHAEFLIKEQKSIRREGLEQDYTDEYWEKRYTIREGDVPPQLEGVKEKVLLAGKYLNVVRECGGVDISKEVQDVPESFDDPRFLDNVNSAYSHANTSLLNLLLTTHSLPARLRSLKHYFFLDRSDFFSYFLELGNSELKKPARNVNTGKLQSLLEIVLRQPGSVAAEDPFKEDVKVVMNEMGLTNWLMRVVNVTGLDQDAANTSMTNILTPAPPAPTADDKNINGFDALVFDYSVPFPLSLVISRVTLTRYQLLFRYLLSLRHLETLLIGSWTEQSKAVSWRHRSSNPKIELWKRKAWTLRARMLCFVQQLLYYCTAEVIEPNWQALMNRLNEKDDNGNDKPSQPKRTVDELMQDHVDFLATCLKECMLTNSKLLRINSKVISTCTMFANFTATFSRYLAAADADLATKAPQQGNGKAKTTASAPSSTAFDPTKMDKLIDFQQKYEDNFTHHLKILLDALNYLAATETVVFLSLCARLSTASEGVPGMTVASYS